MDFYTNYLLIPLHIWKQSMQAAQYFDRNGDGFVAYIFETIANNILRIPLSEDDIEESNRNLVRIWIDMKKIIIEHRTLTQDDIDDLMALANELLGMGY